jgi:hypothetical protein
MRISQISDDNSKLHFENITDDGMEDEAPLEEGLNEIVITSPNLSDWVRLRIIENSEINGVRFPKGVVIDVSQDDGDRLLESGKASYVDEDEIADIKSEVNSKVAETVAPDEISEEPLKDDEKLENEEKSISNVETPLDSEELNTEEKSKNEAATKKKRKRKSEDTPDSGEDETAIADLDSEASIKAEAPEDMLAGFHTEKAVKNK